jgi:hypothetical protein
MANPYLPQADAEFENWFSNFQARLTATPTVFGQTAPTATAVAAQYVLWLAAYALAIDPITRTPVTVAAKDSVKAVATAIVRPVAVQISLNQAVTNGNKVAIGVNVRSFPPTPIPAPTSAPAIVVVSVTPGVQQMRYYDTLTPTTKAKPAGSASLQVWRAVGIAAAVDPSVAVFYGSLTKSPFLSNFDSSQAGKICTYFVRWATRGGAGGISLVGPWGAPLSCVVV